MGDHAATKSANNKSDEEHGICLKYFKEQSSLTRGFRVGTKSVSKEKGGENF